MTDKKIKWASIQNNIAPNKWQRIEKGIFLVGRRYHLLYSVRGRQKREATEIVFESEKKTNIEEVRRALALRKGELASGKYPSLKAEKTTFDALAKDIIADYENNNQEVWRLKVSLNHLSGFFKGMKAINITSDLVMKDYIAYRKKKSPYVANGTLNAELSALIRMFNLALESEPPKVNRALKIRKLSVKGNQRTGFFEIDDYMKLKRTLPEYLVPSFMLAYKSGMRREEIYKLTIEQYNSFEKQLILNPLDTKTKESRMLKLDAEMDDVIRKLIEIRNVRFPNCPYLFFNERGGKIKDFRESWDNALLKAGYELKFICKACKNIIKLNYNPKRKGKIVCQCGCIELKRDNKLFHDLRRTGVRNLVRSTVPEKVAMQISGHKTRTVFERYNITSEQDITAATEKSYEYQKKKEAEYLESIEPQGTEPTPSKKREDSQEQAPTDKVVSLQTYRKKKVS